MPVISGYCTIPPTSGPGRSRLDPTYDASTGTSAFSQVIYNSPSPGIWPVDHSVAVATPGVWHP